MATVTGFTAARMEAIENASIVDGEVVGDNLILTRYDTTTINAGSVRGPTGSPGVTEAEMQDALAVAMPIGSSVEYWGETSPYSNWLAMIGQTVTNAQSLYPTWWARMPASMKSGSNIIMPDTRGRISVGINTSDTDFDTVGKLGGAKTHTLTEAQVPGHVHTGPSHQHAHAHVHGGPNHQHTSPQHTHPISQNTGNPTSLHRHDGNAAGYYFVLGTGLLETTFVEGAGPKGVKAGGFGFSANTYYDTDAHVHTINGVTNQNAAANTGAGGTGNTGPASVTNTDAAGTGNTGSTGGGTAHNNLQPFITCMKIIRVA